MAGRTWEFKQNPLWRKLFMPTEEIEMTVPDSYWKKVVFADECPPCECCGEPWCEKCFEHYADCDCPGPTQDGIIYEERNGVLYGREEE